MILLAAVSVTAAWAWLLLRDIIAVHQIAALPSWPVAALLVAGTLFLLLGRRSARGRGLWATIALTGIAFALFAFPPSNDISVRRAWWRESVHRIANTLRAVGDEVADLEKVSGGLATRVRAALAGSNPATLRSDPTEAFALLDSLAQAVSRGHALTPGTAIGLQLFAPDGTRVAWAGWPQATTAADIGFVTTGTEFLYTRTVSLYQILSHVVPVRNATGELVATLLVDMPLEVDYRVNNRFLKSASLADNVPKIATARVTFEYFPPSGNLPQRLERLEEEAAAGRAQRLSAIQSARTRPRAQSPRGAGADTVLASAFTWQDSVLTYGAFPENVEPEGDVNGDEHLGLAGRALVRSRFGNPLLYANATAEPFEHFLSLRVSTRAAWGTAVALLALVALFVQVMKWIPVRGRALLDLPRLARALIFVVFMVTLRYALLALGLAPNHVDSRLFDPSVFATPALGGLMRSTFDLMVTAVFFVVLVYGVVRILRGRRDRTAEAMPARSFGGVPGALRVLVAGIVVATLGLGALALIHRLIETVVVNANPRLLGESMALTDMSLLSLQLSLFLIISGLLLAAVFVAWGTMRVVGGVRALVPCALALVISVVFCLAQHSWVAFVLMLPFLWFVAFAPRIAQREDLVSVGIAAFALVAIASGVGYVYLTRQYDELRKSFVLEKSKEVNSPADNWKVVILEDVLGDYAARAEIRSAVRDTRPPTDTGSLAFDLWAESPLSLLGYSCAIHVVNAQDSVVSEFSVDMPYRARIGEGGERTDTPEGNRWAVLDLTRGTPQGTVRFYRGIVNIDERGAFEDTTRATPLLGKVIVDLPFFFESLELAARTGPRTPEVLRNVQQGGVAPRVEEPEALLLARVDADHRIVESSSEQLAVGAHVSDATMRDALAHAWPLLHSSTRNYRVVALEPPDSSTAADSSKTLIAGFVVPSTANHLLRWSTLLSLYMCFALVVLVALVLLGAVPRVRNILPTLTSARRVGFQQKLLASFLLVALVPAALLGAFSVDFIKQRFVEENRDEASYKAQSARKAFVNLLHGELQFFLGRSDLAPFLAARGGGAVRDLGGGRVAMLFADSEEPAPAGGAVAGSIDQASTEDLVVTNIHGVPHIGVFSAPVSINSKNGSGSYYVYYGRAVDADLLSEIAEQVGADVNVYADGDLVASSREGLLAGGFISSSMNSSAYVEVCMLGSERALASERAGEYDFQVAYLPLDRWAPADSTGAWRPSPTRAAIAVPLLFRPESYSMEVQRATSVLLGGFALLLAATIGLGLLVARGVFEPLRELVAGTRRISRGDYDVRLRENRSDEVGMVASAFNEMTERIAASQRTLEERRRYLETILENIGTGVMSIGADGFVRTVNNAAERITGMRAQNIIEHDVRELAKASQAAQIFALLANATDGTATPFESGELEFGVGERRATVKYMRTSLEADGRPFGTVLVFEDVTELIESKKLSAWVEMARQIAHEIKNPLTPIRISTQFMRKAYEQRPEDFDRIFKEGTEVIIQQVDVLKRIAGEFSSYGRLQRLDMKPMAIDPFLRGIVTPYENNPNGVRVHYDNGAGNATVMADAEAVRKICANLIENAIEAMGSNGGELHVRCAEIKNQNEKMVRISFLDNGPGLTEATLKRLFEPYFSTKTTGTGLGLAICRTLSREMGGDVTVRNADSGKGVEAALLLMAAK
jgi:PAS domain S-box-containing protein